jgi:glycosyltransferase involved in cell wall biosynthesis
MNSSRRSPKSITINGRFLTQPITGVQRYAYELLSALDTLLHTGAIERIPVTLVVPPNVKTLPQWSWIQIRQAGRYTGQFWEQFDLPNHIRGTLLFTPCGGAPVVHPHHVITIHDAGIFSTPNAYTFRYRNYYKILQFFLSAKATHIITVSEFSQREISRFFRIPPEKITSTMLSGEHILRYEPAPSILSRHQLLPGKYVLAVGSKNPNKNLRGLILASEYLRAPGTDFVFVGGANQSIFSEAQVVSTDIKEPGLVNDNELRTLYENAACFVFPSFYEGFGLPPLEALTLGCPVIVSNAASLPEIFGPIATYCDPHAQADIARQILHITQGSHPGRAEMLSYASRFTWQRCAQATWEILLRAMNG